MKIYTKQGDSGETFDFNGQKISKNDDMLHFIGTIDELNSHLGLIRAMLSNDNAWQYAWKSSCNFIEKIQKYLCIIMTSVCSSNKPCGSNEPCGSKEPCNKKTPSEITGEEVKIIEKEIDRLSVNIPKNIGFTLPGNNIIEAQIHIARTVARRAERLYIAMKNTRELNPQICMYLNRLSDYLFVLSGQESLINVNFINQISGI